MKLQHHPGGRCCSWQSETDQEHGISPINKKFIRYAEKLNFGYVDLQYFNPSADVRFSPDFYREDLVL